MTVNTLRFENESEPNRPLIVERHSGGYIVFQIGTESLTSHPVSLSPSQVEDLMQFLKGVNRG